MIFDFMIVPLMRKYHVYIAFLRISLRYLVAYIFLSYFYFLRIIWLSRNVIAWIINLLFVFPLISSINNNQPFICYWLNPMLISFFSLTFPFHFSGLLSTPSLASEASRIEFQLTICLASSYRILSATCSILFDIHCKILESRYISGRSRSVFFKS